MTRTVAQAIFSALVARKNCLNRQDKDAPLLVAAWERILSQLERECLPSGSGVDEGTKIVLDDVMRGEWFRLKLSFHHMDSDGFYDGWTTHEVSVSPKFEGLRLNIRGKNKNDIKDYLHELLHIALMCQAPDFNFKI